MQASTDQDVQNVGDLLYGIGTNGIAKLMFSEGDAEVVTYSRNGRVFIDTRLLVYHKTKGTFLGTLRKLVEGYILFKTSLCKITKKEQD